MPNQYPAILHTVDLASADSDISVFYCGLNYLVFDISEMRVFLGDLYAYELHLKK